MLTCFGPNMFALVYRFCVIYKSCWPAHYSAAPPELTHFEPFLSLSLSLLPLPCCHRCEFAYLHDLLMPCGFCPHYIQRLALYPFCSISTWKCILVFLECGYLFFCVMCFDGENELISFTSCYSQLSPCLLEHIKVWFYFFYLFSNQSRCETSRILIL